MRLVCLASLDDKPGSLARAPSRILLRWCGHVHDAADLRLAALQRHQRAQEPGGIKAVRLGPPRPPIDQQTGGIQHPVLDAAGAQPAVQPEAVVASLEAAHDPNRPAELLLRLAALARDQREQAVGVAAVQPVLADLVRQGRVEGHAPRGAAQLEGHDSVADAVSASNVGVAADTMGSLLIQMFGPEPTDAQPSVTP